MKITIRVAAGSQQDLMHRLESIESLVQRGATPGERESAEQAKQRILERLKVEYGYEPDQPRQRRPEPVREEPTPVTVDGFTVERNFSRELSSKAVVTVTKNGEEVVIFRGSQVISLVDRGIFNQTVRGVARPTQVDYDTAFARSVVQYVLKSRLYQEPKRPMRDVELPSFHRVSR